MGKVLTSNSASLEHHIIFCQGARLITEYVLNLAKLFGNIESPALNFAVAGFVVHFDVLLNEVDLKQLGHLYCHIQRHGYDDLQHNDKGPEDFEAIKAGPSFLKCQRIQKGHVFFKAG